MRLVRRAVAVILIRVVVTASGSEEQAGQWKEHNTDEQDGPKIESR